MNSDTNTIVIKDKNMSLGSVKTLKIEGRP